MLRTIIGTLVLATSLLAIFAGLVLLTFLGLPLAGAMAIAVLGLLAPFVAGYLTPTSARRTLCIFLITAAVLLILIAGFLVFTRGLIKAWDLGRDGLLVALGYAVVSIPVLLAGAGLSRLANTRRWLRWALRGLGVAGVLSMLVFGVYLRGIGLLPFARGSRLGAYERLWTNLERFYSHWATSPVAPGDLRARYQQRVQAADEACRNQSESCEPYREALRDMLAELQDGHTQLNPSPRLVHPPVAVGKVEGQAVIAWISPGSEAEEAGLEPGMVITSVDGLSVEEALRRKPAWAVTYTAPHTREYYSYRQLLAGSPGTTVTVDVEDTRGVEHTVTLHRTGLESNGEPPIRGHRPSDDLAYIAVQGLWGQDSIATFDRLVDEMLDAPGLILDLRGNGGGNSLLGDQMVGRLITDTVTYGREFYRGRHPMHGFSLGGSDIVVEPRGAPYKGPIAVLINTAVHSSGEWMAAALCDSGRACCFGRTTAGDSGNPVFFFVPDATVQFSTGNFRRLDGTPLNGVGIAPHVEVEWTLEDVRLGRDPDMEAAQAWLR